MATFKIIPILGLRNDIPADDKRLFTQASDGFYCNCVAGENFDLVRKRGVCSKSYGYLLWSNTATAQHTKCLGLFELYDGANRDQIIADNGKIYVYDGSKDPADVSGAVTLSTDNTDLYSMIRVGSYVVIASYAEFTPYAWKHGDAAIAKLVNAGTEYKLRYLVYYMQRIIGFYSDTATVGDIEIRWTGALPTPVTACSFPTANMLYVPNDDSITGAATMGANACFVYSENSIHQMVYYASYATPFKIFTVVPDQGSVNHHSIVPFADRHYMFNKNYGFCEYRGGNQFPYGGIPISESISNHIADIDPTYYNLIMGKYIPWRRQIIWTVPTSASATPNKWFIYDTISKQWQVENIVSRYIDTWRLATYGSITALETAFGTDIEDLDPDNKSWAYYDTGKDKVMFSSTNGHVYYHDTDSYNGSNYTAYREEPVLDFGNPRRSDLLTEIWFDFAAQSNLEIAVSWRGGDTLGEILASSYQSLGTISHFSPAQPFLGVGKNARLHQIRWETTNMNERFQVNGITFKYQPGGER